MKKCLYCSEEVQVDAQKCKHCGEFLAKSDPKVRVFFSNYEKWLKQNYPAYDIVSKDEQERVIVLNKKYKPFNIIVFILLLLLYVFPGLIYAAVTLLIDRIITLTISFDETGKASEVSKSNWRFLVDKYNNTLS